MLTTVKPDEQELSMARRAAWPLPPAPYPVLVGTPIDLGGLVTINKPSMRVRYELGAEAAAALRTEIERMLKAQGV